MTVPLNMRFYRYVVESLNILIPGSDPINVEGKMVTSIIFEKDFDNDYFPVLRLNVMLDPDRYVEIVKNKLNVKFRMRLQKYVYDNNKTVTFKKDVFNTTFCTFIDDNTPYFEGDLSDATTAATNTEKSPTQMAGKQYTFYLFNEDDVTRSKNIYNTVLDGVTMMDTVTWLLSRAGFTSVLMTNFDNKNTYDDVLIPPFPLLGTLQYLDNQYGFHEYGTLLFFDIDRTYFIDRSVKCTAWELNEYKRTTFHIKRTTNPDNLSPGSYDDTDSKTYFINVSPSSISIDNTSITQDQIDGNSLIIVNPSTGDARTITSSAIQRGDGIAKVLINKYNNTYRDNAELLKRQENSRVIQVTLGDYDIDSLSPNKEFVFTFEDTSINKDNGGSYRISYTALSLIRQGEDLVASGTALFKKYGE